MSQNNIPIEQMASELASAIASVIKDKYYSKNESEGIDVFADGGEDEWWFEIWEKRGCLPPRMIFSSPQRYQCIADALFDGCNFAEAVCKL